MVAVTATSVLYAVGVGRGLRGTVLVGGAVLLGQLAIGWQNDAIDAPRDALVERREKPIVAGSCSRRTIALASLVAFLGCIPVSLGSGWRAGLLHLGAVGLASAYNFGLKSTLASIWCYIGAFGSLPVFVALGARGAPLGPWWAAAAAGLLGAGAHLLNTIPDRGADMATGVRGLPQRLTVRADLRLAAGCLLGAAGLLAFASGPLEPAGVATFGLAVLLGAALVAVGDAAPRRGFELCLLLALADVALLCFGRGRGTLLAH